MDLDGIFLKSLDSLLKFILNLWVWLMCPKVTH